MGEGAPREGSPSFGNRALDTGKAGLLGVDVLFITACSLGLTLFPRAPSEGDTLRFIVGASLRATPSAEAASLSRHEPGDRFVVDEVSGQGALCWVRARSGGWIEAVRVDRVPAPVAGNLPVGREGMSSGRVLPWSYEPDDLVTVADSLAAARYRWRTMKLRAPALDAFSALIGAAARDGVRIRFLSAFRTASYQQGLYSRALARDPAQTWSAPPGRSEHQLGTTVDISVPGVADLSEELGQSLAGLWIERNAARFGVAVTYSRERHEDRGVMFEPWHLRWVGAGIRARGGLVAPGDPATPDLSRGLQTRPGRKTKLPVLTPHGPAPARASYGPCSRHTVRSRVPAARRPTRRPTRSFFRRRQISVA